MTDHDGWCQCPVLRAQAEVEKLAAWGVEFDNRDMATHIAVAVLRDKYGCRGPARNGSCPWMKAVSYSGRDLSINWAGPWLERRRSDPDTGQYM